MEMKMTFYKIANPTSGTGFATISQITKLHKIFKEHYVTVIRNRIKVHILKISDDHFLFHGVVPSDKGDEVFYDVVIEMEKKPEELNFLHADLKLWSNDPNFTFSYTWVLGKHNLIPEFLLNKCSPIALSKPPDIRNPLYIWHVHKYTNYLRYHILFKGYLNPVYLNKDYDSTLTLDKINRTILSQNDKLEEVKKIRKKSGIQIIESDIEGK